MIIPHAPNKVEPVKIPNNTHIIDKSIFDEYIFGEGVCLIEWANLIEEILPPHYQTVRIEKVLEKEYLGEIDDETLVEGALKGYVEALGDPYTEYYTKEEMEKLMDTTNGNYVGIGIYMLVDKEKQTIVVLKPMENSPAEQAGILAGDIITKVDGEGYTLDTITEVSNKIKGKAGTKS